jgi:putative transposase
MGRKVRANFIGSARTYGARRVWRDVLAEGVFCGLHRIERLMQAQAFRARPLPAARRSASICDGSQA